MSLIPMVVTRSSPIRRSSKTHPDFYLNMGLTAENLARKYSITRADADEFSFRSHQKAIAAISEGKFKDEVVPLTVETVELDWRGKRVVKETIFDTDEGPRADTSIEALGKLRPAFHARGTVTPAKLIADVGRRGRCSSDVGQTRRKRSQRSLSRD